MNFFQEQHESVNWHTPRSVRWAWHILLALGSQPCGFHGNKGSLITLRADYCNLITGLALMVLLCY